MSFKDAWDRAGEPADDFDPPNGRYQVRIVDAGAFAGRDGREWAKVRLEVTNGEHQGRQFDDFMNLNNEVGLRIARTNLTMYGLNPDVEDLEQLDTGMLELVGNTATISVKHSSAGFVNVSVTRVSTGESDVPGQGALDFQPAAARREEAQNDPDDDIPF